MTDPLTITIDTQARLGGMPNLARVTRINKWLEQRNGAEQEIAKELRAELDAVGEKRWLGWVDQHWGWKRAAAYLHLTPGKVDQHRTLNRGRMAASRARPTLLDTQPPQAARPHFTERESRPTFDPLAYGAGAATKALAVEMFSTGFREMSKKTHPDVGGSSEAQAKLVNARDWGLKRLSDGQFGTLLDLIL